MKINKYISVLIALLLFVSMASISQAVPITDRTGKNFVGVNPDGTQTVDINRAKSSFASCSRSVQSAATATPKQILVIQHPVTSNKKVSIVKVTANTDSNSAVTVLSYSMSYITSTTPASGGNAILPASFDPADVTSNAESIEIPSTAGSTVSTYSLFSITSALVGSTVGGTTPSIPNPFTIYEWKNGSSMKPLTLRPFTAEGYAVNVTASANSTVQSTVCAYFTEE
jgi:hypothetical protein